MAKITTVELVDDITGESDSTVRTVNLSFDHSDYELDLGEDSLTALNEALAPFLQAATPVKSSSPRSGVSKGSDKGKGKDTKEIRAWAQKNYDGIGERGRIPKEIVEAYRAQVAA